MCAAKGPPPFPGAQGYWCSLPSGHDGAHLATVAGRVVDTWGP